MKKLLLPFALLLLTGMSCTKTQVEEKVADIAMKIMSDGEWIITKFVEGTNETTGTFQNWECKFYENGTCEAKNGALTVKGTWSANTLNKNITGQFPAGSNPVDRINGTWTIVRNNTTFGEFTQTKNGLKYTMELTKK